MNQPSLADGRTFGRYVPVERSSSQPEVRPTIEQGDLGRFLAAFAGGFVFFSILIF